MCFDLSHLIDHSFICDNVFWLLVLSGCGWHAGWLIVCVLLLHDHATIFKYLFAFHINIYHSDMYFFFSPCNIITGPICRFSYLWEWFKMSYAYKLTSPFVELLSPCFSHPKQRVSFVRSFAERYTPCDNFFALICLDHRECCFSLCAFFFPFSHFLFLFFFFILLPLGNFLHYYHSLLMFLRFLLDQCIITYKFRKIYS